ncbi:hypothetical protein BC777_1314 [Yoonia maricola]|uniref:TadE-like protein n=1 Tax=Yoonia maricola TaxID=420999 RepID=A0A2M8WNH3_9RHOB|nr:hypothetical protein [Yoonia maricola]PJI92463.1 hypothetical protein BC777_1314 [Yoonia maricola]
MKNLLHQFWNDQKGTSSIEIVLVFPIFFGFFLMTYESGILSARQVMLEHGVDVTVRQVRIGIIAEADPDDMRDELRTKICKNAGILPDCERQLELEMIQRDPTVDWVPLDDEIACVDRSDIDRDSDTTIDETANNELIFLRACIRIDPFLPSSNLGKALVEGNDDVAGASYALFATSAFVVEPFRAEEDS